MHKTNYGGRYSTNLIEDIATSKVSRSPEQTRTDLTNYRPFEELAQNFKAARPLPMAMKKQIDIMYRSSKAHIGVNRLSPATNAYTYIPPLTTLGLDFSSFNKVDIIDKLQRTFSSLIARLSAFIVLGIPRKSYNIHEGVTHFWNSKIYKYVALALIPLLLLAGFLLLKFDGNAFIDPKTNNNKPSVIRNTVNKTSGTGGTTGAATSNQNTDSNPTASGQTGAAPASSSTQPATDGTALPQGSTTPTYYGRGGGTTSTGSSWPTTSSSSTTSTSSSPTTSSSTTSTPNPATIVPYSTVTVPSTSVQTDTKQVIGTSPLTVTTN